MFLSTSPTKACTAVPGILRLRKETQEFRPADASRVNKISSISRSGRKLNETTGGRGQKKKSTVFFQDVEGNDATSVVSSITYGNL